MIWLPALFIVWSLFGRNYAQSIDSLLMRHNGPDPIHNHPGWNSAVRFARKHQTGKSTFLLST